MALRPILESLDGLPEDVSKEYAAYTGEESALKGRFVLQVTPEDGFALENIQGLRNALGAEKEARRRANEKLGRFVDSEGKPLDPVELVGSLDRLAGLESGKINPDDLETRLAHARETEAQKWSGKLTESEKLRGSTEKKYRDSRIRNAALLAIAAHKGKAKPLLPHVEAVADLRVHEDGREELIIKDDQGNARLSQETGNTGNMTFDEFVGKVLKSDGDFRGSFEGTGASGSGSGGESRDVVATSISPDLPPAEQLKQARRLAAGSG
jgi:hypothetical protein